MLTLKFLKTIDERKNVAWCVVDCKNIDSIKTHKSSNIDRNILKNSNLSSLIFLSNERPGFQLFAEQNYSTWNIKKFSIFIDIWGKGKLIMSRKLPQPIFTKCHNTYNFPLFDLDPALYKNNRIDLVSLYLLESESTNNFNLYMDKKQNRLIIIEQLLDDTNTKCLI